MSVDDIDDDDFMIAIERRKPFDRYLTFSRRWVTIDDEKSPLT